VIPLTAEELATLVRARDLVEAKSVVPDIDEGVRGLLGVVGGGLGKVLTSAYLDEP